eukprot:3826180-Rhodomonas_salina.1
MERGIRKRSGQQHWVELTPPGTLGTRGILPAFPLLARYPCNTSSTHPLACGIQKFKYWAGKTWFRKSDIYALQLESICARHSASIPTSSECGSQTGYMPQVKDTANITGAIRKSGHG